MVVEEPGVKVEGFLGGIADQEFYGSSLEDIIGHLICYIPRWRVEKGQVVELSTFHQVLGQV